MSVNIEENSGGKERFELIDANPPEGVTVLPTGVTEEDSKEYLLYPNNTETIRKLLEQNGVEYTEISANEEKSTLVLRSEELTLATLYFSYKFVRDNWDQIRFGIEKISGFYSKKTDGEVELSVEQEIEDGSTTKLTYNGPAKEMEKLSDEIATVVGIQREKDSENE